MCSCQQSKLSQPPVLGRHANVQKLYTCARTVLTCRASVLYRDVSSCYVFLCAAGRKEIVTGSLDKTIALWRLEVVCLCHCLAVSIPSYRPCEN